MKGELIFFGISEPNVQTVKSGNKYRIAVELPGIQDVSTAVDLIGSTAQLSFRTEKQSTQEAKISTNEAIFQNLTEKTGLTGKDVKKGISCF